MATIKTPPPARNYRDAGTGLYVPKRDADKRPKETVSEPRNGGGKKDK